MGFHLPHGRRPVFTGSMPLPIRRALFFLVGAVAPLTLLAQDHPEPSPPAKPAAIIAGVSESPVDLDQGRHLFEAHCATCHGPNGEGGKGPTLAQPSLPRASDYESLLKIISGGINGTEMPPAHLERKDIELVAKFVKSLNSRPREAVSGNVEHGAQIYAKKGGCAQCHMLDGQGGVFGPDLSDVGLRRSSEYLRRSLVDPSADVPQSYTAWRTDISLPENFLFVRLVTRDGQEISGVRMNEDTFSIQIRQANGAIKSYLKSELAELHKDTGKSPMPSYATALTTNELDDLVAFLASLRHNK
jgi:putative heme-binding domain-containing protein